MKNLPNQNSMILGIIPTCVFLLCIASIPLAEAKIAEPYILRYDVQERNLAIEKIIQGDEGIFWIESKWGGPHDPEGEGDLQSQQIIPFYQNQETYFFQYVDDFGIYTIFKIDSDGKGLEVIWRSEFDAPDMSYYFAILNFNDNPYLFSIDLAGSWKFEKILIKEKELQNISQGEWSEGWNNLIPLLMDEEQFLFIYKGGEKGKTSSEWQIWKMSENGPRQIESEGFLNSGMQILGINFGEPHILSWNAVESNLYKINSEGQGISKIFDNGKGFGNLEAKVNAFNFLEIPHILNYNQIESEESPDVTFFEIKKNAMMENVGQSKWGIGWDEVVTFTIWSETCPIGNQIEDGECVPIICPNEFHLEDGNCVPNTCIPGMSWDESQQQCVVSIPGGVSIPEVSIPGVGDSDGGCLIATATYGSELAPQVQQLRELRDNKLLQTESGFAFMNTFNGFYYSFSPTIADYERENPIFKEVVKLAITPLISSLSILNQVEMESELEVLGYGISLILLNLGMYGGIPILSIFIIKLRKKGSNSEIER